MSLSDLYLSRYGHSEMSASIVFLTCKNDVDDDKRMH